MGLETTIAVAGPLDGAGASHRKACPRFPRPDVRLVESEPPEGVRYVEVEHARVKGRRLG